MRNLVPKFCLKPFSNLRDRIFRSLVCFFRPRVRESDGKRGEGDGKRTKAGCRRVFRRGSFGKTSGRPREEERRT
ncbi:hypothetical protein KFK09_005301 [Dendrobium nobile]|uniref:Uncharacterized protein n=1 Tax=Dendrobium nobile TaxID=94219 RepID=A0A8T3BY24_DENNO|nr:hypothetical protein KFK09_005300 [Dendrobium nobile]KAI0522912.1 hypothetical protein KFK09_005301 [Dendrobium nobile]